MKDLTIVVPAGQGNNLSSIVGTYKIFSKANEYQTINNKKEQFRVQLAGVTKKVDFYDGLFTVTPHTHISAIPKTHLIIIPSLNHNYQKALKENKLLIDWIENQYKQGSEIASICTGAFLIASTGLLDGKTCSTHWSAADNFRKMFPKINLQTEKLITDENGIYTNGGAFSFLNLIIYLIRPRVTLITLLIFYCFAVLQTRNH